MDRLGQSEPFWMGKGGGAIFLMLGWRGVTHSGSAHGSSTPLGRDRKKKPRMVGRGMDTDTGGKASPKTPPHDPPHDSAP